jgi:hypothetical protein
LAVPQFASFAMKVRADCRAYVGEKRSVSADMAHRLRCYWVQRLNYGSACNRMLIYGMRGKPPPGSIQKFYRFENPRNELIVECLSEPTFERKMAADAGEARYGKHACRPPTHSVEF